MRKRWKFQVLLTAGVLTFILLCDLLAAPYHERHGGEFTSWLNGIARILETPGLIVAEFLGARYRHHTTRQAWLIMLVATPPMYLLLGGLLRRAWLGRRADTLDAEPTESDEPATTLLGGSLLPMSGLPGATLSAAVMQTPLLAVEAAGSVINDRVAAEDRVSDRRSMPSHVAGGRSEEEDRGSERSQGPVQSTSGPILLTRRAAMLGLAGTAAFAFAGDLRNIELTQHVVPIRGLPAVLAGLRIVQLSDIHHGPWTSLAYIRRIVAQTNALNPDLIALTGDYVHQSRVYIAPVVQELARLRAKVAVVGTLGNHDWWENGPETIQCFNEYKLPLLDNTRRFISADRTLEKSLGRDDQKHGLCIAGLGDLWEGRPNCEAALGGVPPEMPRLVLAHNPDTAETAEVQQANERIDLMLSGHTHGGQIWVPGLGTPITPSAFGQKYAHGFVRSPCGLVYVNRGVGSTVIPLRLRVRPEITQFTLKPMA